MAITEPYNAWCFDEAVAVFGASCEEAMTQARRPPKNTKLNADQLDARADNALRRMLGMKQKFRSIHDLSRRP